MLQETDDATIDAASDGSTTESGDGAPSTDDGRDGGEATSSLTRRAVLAATGGAAASLAGCSMLSSPSFAATPVVLPEDGQAGLLLPEVSQDSSTIERENPTGGDPVEITNQTAVYRRSATGEDQ